MSKIAKRIKTAQDQEGMLRRALERIIKLYTDRSHFVFELLQNAEDAEAKRIRFVQFGDRLEVLHDGKPFTTENLESLCDIGKSDKEGNLNQIGEFGVGFKSVFCICDTVRLFSEPSHYDGNVDDDVIPFSVEINDFTSPEDIAEEPMPSGYTTRFVFPYAVGHSYSGFSSMGDLVDTLSRKLQNLGITTLLFMKHLVLIEFEIETDEGPITGEYLLEKKKINDHCSLISALGRSEKESAETEEEEVLYYLTFSRQLDRYPQRTVDIAFSVKKDQDGYHCVKAPNPYVSVYFPTETESKLDFIVQGPFRTTPNRSSIPVDNEENSYLAAETAKLLRDSLLELKDEKKLNMSFVRVLPIVEERFNAFGLFYPLYETVQNLFRTEAIIPSKSEIYVRAQYAKIARQERLASVFTDELLSGLINDGAQYFWLPTNLTETNKEYRPVLEFLTSKLKVQVLRPEDLRTYYEENPKFLPERSNDWLVELYSIYENIPGVFSRSKSESNMATASIVKTASGAFAAPYRREGKTFIPNVFLPSNVVRSSDINIVDAELYERCRHFFDDVLQLKKPNEYEIFIKDIKKRYQEGHIFDDEQHIEDIKALLKYRKREEYEEEVKRIIEELLVLKCTDGNMRSCHSFRIFLPISTEGLNIEGYFRNVRQNVFYVDEEYYSNYDIETEDLLKLGVCDTIVTGEDQTNGPYDTGSNRGKQPEWWTSGDFRWKFSIEALQDVLKYISLSPNAKDSIIKSQTIMKVLTLNESRLSGLVHITGTKVPDKENEPCEMIHVLRGERTRDWDGKWLYTESVELVSPKTISKHEINTSIYGMINPGSIINELIGFKKTDAEEVDELKKTVSVEKLEAFFESELKQRFGISTLELNERLRSSGYYESVEETKLPFPSRPVRSWEALKKHAVEMLVYADPVRYEKRIRSVRVSNHPMEARAYLSNMYRHEGNYRFKFACQMCHETCSSFRATEIFLNPETELDPLNLCLCPNCSAKYQEYRSNKEFAKQLRNSFIKKEEHEIENGDYVVVQVGDDELWFTQTHFAEIRELLRLPDETKRSKRAKVIRAIKVGTEEDEGNSDMSVYKSYIGQTIRRKDGFVGVITDVVMDGDDGTLSVRVTDGKTAGTDTKIKLSFILANRDVYMFSDK